MDELVDNRLVLDVARDRLRTQLAFADAIEAKISILFAVGSTLVGILAAVLAIDDSLDQSASATLIAVAVVSYVGLTFVWWMGAGPAEWSIGPKVGELQRSIEVETDRRIVDRLIESYKDHYRDNERTKSMKECMLRIGFGLVVGETVYVAFAALLIVLG